VASTGQITAAVHAHIAAVGAADADALASLYAEAAELHDPAGTRVAVGRDAIRSYFAGVLTDRRETELVFLAVVDHAAAFHFRAKPPGGPARNVIDTMTFDDDGAITSMSAYAAPPPHQETP
jgi:steroid delta-isomerase